MIAIFEKKTNYLMIKYVFYITMYFTVITYIYGFVCISMEFVLHILVFKECIVLMLLSIILISAVVFSIGNIVFEMEFRKQL